jgi:hypothetical protein
VLDQPERLAGTGRKELHDHLGRIVGPTDDLHPLADRRRNLGDACGRRVRPTDRCEVRHEAGAPRGREHALAEERANVGRSRSRKKKRRATRRLRDQVQHGVDDVVDREGVRGARSDRGSTASWPSSKTT